MWTLLTPLHSIHHHSLSRSPASADISRYVGAILVIGAMDNHGALHHDRSHRPEHSPVPVAAVKLCSVPQHERPHTTSMYEPRDTIPNVQLHWIIHNNFWNNPALQLYNHFYSPQKGNKMNAHYYMGLWASVISRSNILRTQLTFNSLWSLIFSVFVLQT